MPIRIEPTLAQMSKIYDMPKAGGATSERFVAYCNASAQGSPIKGYNPMASDLVADTVRRLIACDAETIAVRSSNEVAKQVGLVGHFSIHITVATPGMWTDRLATEVEHRLKGTDPSGILLWFDDEVTDTHIRAQAIAQTVRLEATLARADHMPATLRHAVTQEGVALALAGSKGEWDQQASDVLEGYGADDSLATMVAYLYGDDVALKMGYEPLGLGDRVGYRHAVAISGR